MCTYSEWKSTEGFSDITKDKTMNIAEDPSDENEIRTIFLLFINSFFV